MAFHGEAGTNCLHRFLTIGSQPICCGEQFQVDTAVLRSRCLPLHPYHRDFQPPARQAKRFNYLLIVAAARVQIAFLARPVEAFSLASSKTCPQLARGRIRTVQNHGIRRHILEEGT